MRFLRCWFLGVAAVAITTPVLAVSTLNLPVWVCHYPDALFVSGFETAEALPHDPSSGSGGALAANQVRNVSVTDFGGHNYYLHIPSGYSSDHAWPVLLALHGAAGSPALAETAAQVLRDDWAAVADSNGFIVAAPVASGSMGGWIAPGSAADYPTDYDVFAAVFADIESAYNIDRTRRYGWGFSAGGYVMHDVMLNNFNASVNANSLAAYGVDGATLGFACPTVGQCDALLSAATRFIPVDIHIGLMDSTRLSAARDDHTRFLSNGWIDGSTVFYTEFSGGHTYAGQLPSVWSSLCPFALVP